MSVIVEFTIDRDQMALGQALAGAGSAHIELEKVVPTGNVSVPFFWIDDPDESGLAESIGESNHVEVLVELDTVGDRTLYRVEWSGENDDFLEGIQQFDGVILEGEGTDVWRFVLRFDGHDDVSDFYDFCTDHDFRVHIERTYTLTSESMHDRTPGLTDQQREALTLALERGYFEAPREVEMVDLADECDISQQAFSERLRRGLQKVLANAL